MFYYINNTKGEIISSLRNVSLHTLFFINLHLVEKWLSEPRKKDVRAFRIMLQGVDEKNITKKDILNTIFPFDIQSVFLVKEI